MNTTAYSKNAPGRLIKTKEGYWAFVPSPLPPPMDPTMPLLRALSRADRAIAALGGVSRNLPNPQLLIRPFLRREAVLSSRIEGTQASISDVMFFEGTEANAASADVREVVNNVKAMEYGIQRLDSLPLSKRLICEMHKILMEGVRGYHQTPGEFRRSQNWIGSTGSTLSTATYVPPPPLEMQEALNDLELFLHQNADLPPLLKIAMAHYQFEAIHPFLDGNGRIGRLLISLLTVTEKMLPLPFLYLSVYFEKNRPEYYSRLLAVSERGEWDAWFLFFLEGVAEQSEDALRRAQSLLALMDLYRQKLREAKDSALTIQLMEELFATPVVTIGSVQERLAITHRGAKLLIERLMERGVLQEAEGSSRRRVFFAAEIIKLIEADNAKTRYSLEEDGEYLQTMSVREE